MPPPGSQAGLKAIVHFVQQVGTAWHEDYVASMGAALAYYTLFSLAPLLLIVIAVAGLVFGETAAKGELQVQLAILIGQRSASTVRDLLAHAHRPTSEGIAASLLGLGLLVAGAASMFGELQDALDRIWRVPATPPRNGWLALLRSRLLSYAMILALGLLLIASLVTSAAMATFVEFGRTLSPVFGSWQQVAQIGNATGSLALSALVFALIFKVMPRVHVQWKDVWVGALFTAGLFALGKTLIGVYIGLAGAASGFGAAGSLVVLLLWVYWSAQILLIGAVFTWVYANQFGSRRVAGPQAASAP